MNKKRVIVLHGAFGNSTKNWFPWLSNKTSELGIKTIIPNFPTPDGQELRNWLNRFDNEVGLIETSDILIGHSLGSPFILRLLERINLRVNAVFLTAAFSEFLNIERFDSINYSFVDHPFNWEKIKGNCEKFYIYNSDDDPYVPMKCGETIAKNLGTSVTVVSGGKHLNDSAGFKEFPQLWNDLYPLLKSKG